MNRKASSRVIPPPSATNEDDAADNAVDEIDAPSLEEGYTENIADDDDGDVRKESPFIPPFDRSAVSKKLHDEEVDEIKKSQRFLLKQQRRRMLDKTWLDRGITSIIEFFENVFRWEVIDV